MADGAGASEGGAAGEGVREGCSRQTLQGPRVHCKCCGNFYPARRREWGKGSSSQHGARGLSVPVLCDSPYGSLASDPIRELKLFPSPGPWEPVRRHGMCMFGSLASPCFPAMD